MNPFKNKKGNGEENIGLDRYYPFFALLIGVIVTFIFYRFIISQVLYGTYYYDIFTKRGSIPYITSFLFFWGAALLFFSWFGLRKENATFDEIRKNIENLPVIDKENARDAILILKTIRKEKHGNIASNRFIRAMRRIRDGIKQVSEISEMLRDQADIDSMIISNKYAPVKFFIWLIPVLGFIGTVLGVSFAISGFSDIIMAGSDFSAIKGNLGGVTNSLGIAFDTTLLALVKTALLMYAYSTLQKQEQSFLITMDEFSVDDLMKKIVPDVKKQDKSETAQLTDSIDLLTEKITTWDPRFADTLESFYTRLEQHSNEVIDSVMELVNRSEQVTDQNAQTAITISESIDRFKDYSGDVERSVQELFAQVKETTGQNSQTAVTISESMDRFRDYSSNVDRSVQEFFAQVKETTGRNSETAVTISESMDRFKNYSSDVERYMQELFTQVKETTGQNSQTAVTISESMDRFKNYSSDVERSVQDLSAKIQETTGQNSQVVMEISQSIQALTRQINEFNTLQESIQNNIKCITDLEEFNRCLGGLSDTLDKLPKILTEMMRPREIRLTESILSGGE